MEFLNFIAPGGALRKAWVAAHWERQLRRQDYLTTDVKALANSIRDRVQTFSLRNLGHLLLGSCRILRWKAQLLEEEACGVRANIIDCTASAFSRGGGDLETIRIQAESALTLRRGSARDVNLNAGMMDDDLDFADGIDMVSEPDMDLQPMEVDACLEEGRKHVAKVETITLSPDHSDAFQGIEIADSPSDAFVDDVFGAPSLADHEAMDRLSQSPDLQPIHSAPPLDHLLGNRIGSAADSLPLHGSGRFRPETEEEVPPPLDYLLGNTGSVVDSLPLHDSGRSGFPPLVDGVIPGLRSVVSEPGGFSGEDVPTPSPARLQRRLESEFDTLAGVGQLPDLSEAGLESSELAQFLQFSPGPLEISPESIVAVEAPEAADLADPLQPPRKRRRKPRPWLDEETELSNDVYRDTSAITLSDEDKLDYTITLPHKAPHIGYTTSFGDLCDKLCQSMRDAPVVRQLQMQAMLDQVSADREAATAAAASAATASASSSALAPAIHSAVGGLFRDDTPPADGGWVFGAGLTPDPASATPRDTGLFGTLDWSDPRQPTPQPTPLPAVSPGHIAPTAVDASTPGSQPTQPIVQLEVAASAEEFRLVHDPNAIGASPFPAPWSGAVDELPAPLTGPAAEFPEAPDMDERMDSQDGVVDDHMAGVLQEGVADDLMAGVLQDGVAEHPVAGVLQGDFSELHRRTHAGAEIAASIGAPPQHFAGEVAVKIEGHVQHRGEVDVKIEAIDEVWEESVPMGPVQEIQLRQSLGRVGEVSTSAPEESFASLCSGGGAEAAASRFMHLLSMHMEGVVSLGQTEPYGDITIGRGPSWL